MLLSITLIGFLMVALLIGLRVASRAWQTGEARLRVVHAEAERNAFVVQQISSLVPYQVTSSDPDLPGTFVIFQADAACLRLVTSYSSVFRNRSGLVLAEYGIFRVSSGGVEVALRETAVGDNNVLLHGLVKGIENDPDTMAAVIRYQPFFVTETDLALMTGLEAAGFDYLDLHPKKDAGPVWLAAWKPTDKKPYPDAIRLRWVRKNQEEEEIFPVRANFVVKASTGE